MPRYDAADGTYLHFDELSFDELSPRSPGSDSAPLIVLAGGAARHPSYLGDLAGLSDEHALVVPHLRGVGHSPAPTALPSGSYWHQADDIERLRQHLGLESLTVIAHSAGTRLALAYAVRFPQRLARLVLITPPALHLVGTASDIEALAARRNGDAVFNDAFALLSAGPPTDNEGAFTDWMQRTAPASYARWGAAERTHSMLGRWDLPAAKAYFTVDPPVGFVQQLAGVSTPVLVVAGAEDCLTGFAPVLALARLFSAGEVSVIDGAGHYPWVEQPRQFRRAVDGFLERESSLS